MNSLFKAKTPNEHPHYAAIRDKEIYKWYRLSLEAMFKKYYLLLDKDFRDKFPKEFFQRYAELRAAHILCNDNSIDIPEERKARYKYKNGKQTGSPDFILDKKLNGRRVCVEVVCPNIGTTKNKVLPHNWVTISEEDGVTMTQKEKDFLDTLIVFRFKKALDSKVEQFKGWIEKGICNKDDILIIMMFGNLINYEADTVSLEREFFTAICGQWNNCEQKFSPKKIWYDKNLIDVGAIHEKKFNILSGFLFTDMQIFANSKELLKTYLGLSFENLGEHSQEFTYITNRNATNNITLSGFFRFAKLSPSIRELDLMDRLY